MDFDKVERFLKAECGDVNFMFACSDKLIKDDGSSGEVHVLDLMNNMNGSVAFAMLESALLKNFIKRGMSFDEVIQLVAMSLKSFLMVTDGVEKNKDLGVNIDAMKTELGNDKMYVYAGFDGDPDLPIKMKLKGCPPDLLYILCKVISYLCENAKVDVDATLEAMREVIDGGKNDILIDMTEGDDDENIGS